MDTGNKFYLGKEVEAQTDRVKDQPFLYDPADLTTHALVVGMTGSGKTGLCIAMLEEAALLGIPALMVDPKGDITNTLLHFPDLAPQDFLPWVNDDQARRQGISVEQVAQAAAETWTAGLAEWGIGQERISRLKDSALFTVFTPGSDAGVPVNILASLKAPSIPWEGNREILREKISGTVTALLGLVGMQDIDPVRSREHILLANLFEFAWSKGKDLDLGELILQTQNPPFTKLGVFDVDVFFPEKDRNALAMLLNNILASPGFQAWIEGQPLDIPALLYTTDGKPRQSVFYIAHLSDEERMFFIILLYSAVESWMRSQPGTSLLRAILYFDEVFGYLPPIANPPSKPILLRMLKQARAFGVGLVLVTQNPVDVDYKALSNAGSWFIGKLQTENDKLRLLDGLESAAGGGLDRGMYEQMISGLGKRFFLLHNVHQKAPVLFKTRWTMNYLAGPLTRSQIPLLNQLRHPAEFAAQLPDSPIPPESVAGIQKAAEMAYIQDVPLESQPSLPTVAEFPVYTETSSISSGSGSLTRPTLPSGVVEYILPNNLTMMEAFEVSKHPYPQEAFNQGLLYRPVLLAQASVRFLNRKYNLDYLLVKTAIVSTPDRRGIVRWDDRIARGVTPSDLDREPIPQAHYAALELPFTDKKIMEAIKQDFINWVYRQSQVVVRANEVLGIYAGPDISQAGFRKALADAAREKLEAEVNQISAEYTRKIDMLKQKLSREERELDADRSELSHRRMEEMGAHAENVLGLFTKRRTRVSSSLTKRRLTDQAKADVEESVDTIKEIEEKVAALEEEQAGALEVAKLNWSETANQIVEIPLVPYKKDVLLDAFGVAWMPYYIVKTDDHILELPGYEGGGFG